MLPLTYAFDALDRASLGVPFGSHGWADVTVIVGVTPCSRCRRTP